MRAIPRLTVAEAERALAAANAAVEEAQAAIERAHELPDGLEATQARRAANACWRDADLVVMAAERALRCAPARAADEASRRSVAA